MILLLALLACNNTVRLQAPLWFVDADNDGFGAWDADGDGVEDVGQRDFDPDANLGPGPWVDNDLDCDDTDPAVTSIAWMVDADGDGYPGVSTMMDTMYSCEATVPGYAIFDGAFDCADGDATIHPGQVERCNGVDDDCDGQEESPDAAAWCDGDGDGWGAGEELTCGAACAAVLRDGDCDDGDPAVYPGAAELCGGIDNDCDGEPMAIPTWYRDADGDGFGEQDEALAACDQPAGHVADGSDCDDGFAATWPGASEVCDGRDNDCDTIIDDGWPLQPYYQDADGDGFGADEIQACKMPPLGYVDRPGDCDDHNDTIHPGADEICDGVDDDCDGAVDDDAADAATWHGDGDGDGYGDPDVVATGCGQPTGFVADATDCDDVDTRVHPGVSESCNGLDDDCDGAIDEEAVDWPAWYVDGDGDGHGDSRFSTRACAQPVGYVDCGSDCSDLDPDVYSGAPEHCNGVDDDCDGIVDEEAVDPAIWYSDQDRDGFGDPATWMEACDPGSGYVANMDDCADTDAGVHPGSAELCDGIDEDCDGSTDEDAVDTLTWYLDADGDGFGSSRYVAQACDQPTWYVESSDDCDDTDPGDHLGATEIIDNGDDEDCDGQELCFDDADDDGWLAPPANIRVSMDSDCNDAYEGTNIDSMTDCNDRDASVNPGVEEICSNGVDDNCDGSVCANLFLTDARLVGESTWFEVGYSVSGAGDVDNDGFADILVGAHTGNKAYLLYGPVTANEDLSQADVELLGEEPGDSAGASVSGAGDVNGDGFADILVGAYYNDDGGYISGAAYLLYGPITADRDLSLADAELVGESSRDDAGLSVSGAGDVDDDGYADILVGAVGADAGSFAGAAYLLYGPVPTNRDLSLAEAKLMGENAGDQAGSSVSSAGDVNGDGFADILVGAPYNDEGGSEAGAVYLLHGPITADRSLAMADAKLMGEDAGDEAGNSVSGAGDVNADGFADLLVGAWRNNEGGAAYLLHGPVTADRDLSLADAKLVGANADDLAGSSVSGAGDVDDDGFADILVGAPYNDDGGNCVGAVYLLFGPVTADQDLSLADVKFVGGEFEERAGNSVAGAGDVDADGTADILVGASSFNLWMGAVYLLYGGTL